MTSELEGKNKRAEKKAYRGNKSGMFNDAQFIRYELDKAGVQACKKWACDETAAFAGLHRLADRGYRASIRWDDFNTAYMCSLSQGKADGDNAGYILVGRGSTPFKAVKQVLFKHFEVMDEVWASFAGFGPGAEIDD